MPRGAFCSGGTRMDDPSPRERDYPMGSVYGQSVMDFSGYLFRGVTILGVVDHALSEDAGANDDRLAKHLAANLFHFVAT
jgi:hypothetical protein